MRSKDISFTGTALAPAMLPWGQRFMREAIRRVEPIDHHLNLAWSQEVPPGADLDAVCNALGALVSRHESLRTRYGVDGSGHPVQEVIGQGAFTVRIHELGTADLEDAASAAIQSFRDQRYDLKQAPLLRATVIARDGRPRVLVIGLSHMVTDGWGARRIVDELTGFMDPGEVGAAGAPEVTWQPSDQIRHEQTQAATNRRDRSLDYLEGQFQNFPSTMFWQRQGKTEDPRYWSGSLHSPALLPAVAAMYRTHSVTPAPAILAAFSAVVGHVTCHDTCRMFVIQSNRNRRNMDSVANYSQTVPLGIELNSDSFWSLTKDTQSAMLNASRFASYPPETRFQLSEDIGERRGIRIAEDCVYNPQWWMTGPELARLADSGDAAAELPARSGTFTWNKGADSGLVMYFGTSPTGLTITADTRFVAPEQFEPLLRLVEDIVVRGAKEDFSPSEMLERHPREIPDHEWAFIDNCWVSLEATRGMVAEATGAVAVDIETVRDQDGRECLSALISGSASEMSLGEVRTRCLAVLPRWRSAMVPHRLSESR
ncbi:condensation domain-containing protein [Glycomyces rhizosphaerae]|uniref:Condensation domain-containing protein n=1 Tax=Glycomyces rhizosphaerae TaxID=2054422 RepID=A0ABV7Q7N2_9ACTN